ncbi:MAG: response regulator [Desulfocapsaceae bacterium]|nr:response regulator [Desulfocapsaceae bacterium]
MITFIPKATILIVEDDQFVRQSMAIFLEMNGFHVLQATNGRDGLELFIQKVPDLIILDLQMPEMSGLELLAAIRNDLAVIPAIVVSGTGTMDVVIETLKFGAWDYLTKPFESQDILGLAVNQALEKARLIKENKRYQFHLEELVSQRTAELQRQEQEAQQIFASVPLAISFLDMEMRVIRLNPAMEALVGMTSEEVLGHHCYDCCGQYAGDDTRLGIERICDNCQMPATLRKGEKHLYKRRLGNKIFEITTSPVWDLKGKIVGAMEVAADITERYYAAQTLLESEERYRALFTSSPNIICIADFSGIKKYFTGLSRQGVKDFDEFFQANLQEASNCLSQLRISEVNQSALSLFGAVSHQELVQRLFTVFGSKTSQSIIGMINVISKGETVCEREIILHTLQGNKIYAIFRCNVLPGYEEWYDRVIITFVDITERKNAEVKLAQHRKQLQQLSSRLIDVEEIERRRIARELHDQVGQQLTSLGLNLHIMAQSVPPEQRKRVDDSLKLIKIMTEQVRDIMADLRPPVLDDYGLCAALRWYGTLFAKRTMMEVIIVADIQRLSTNLEMALFRITQEALNNVIKHSMATKVEIRCSLENNLLSLAIIDNGCGIQHMDEGALAESQTWGLLSMRERIEAFGGRLIVVSSPGNGTHVTIKVQI